MKKLLVVCALLANCVVCASDQDGRLVVGDPEPRKLFEEIPQTPEQKAIVKCARGVSIVFMKVGDYCKEHPYDNGAHDVYRKLNTLVCRAVTGKYTTVEELKKDSCALGLTDTTLEPYLKS